MATAPDLEAKSYEANASDLPSVNAYDGERITKNVQGRTEVTLIPRPSDSPKDPLVCDAFLLTETNVIYSATVLCRLLLRRTMTNCLSLELAHLKEIYFARRPQFFNLRWFHYRACDPAGDCSACRALWCYFNTCGAPGKICPGSKTQRY
jgi:hypothetical protein